jgi:putative membrane protein
LSSCDENKTADNDQNKDSKEIAEAHNDAKFDKAKEDDAQFIVDAVEMSNREIRMGELAATHGSSKELKEMAAMLVADHKKAVEELNAVAKKKQITVPVESSDDTQKEFDDLNKKNGADFDKDYCDQMVEDHKEAVKKFEKASTDSEDYEIKATANKMLPELRKHLDACMAMQEKHKDGHAKADAKPKPKVEVNTNTKPDASKVGERKDEPKKPDGRAF